MSQYSLVTKRLMSTYRRHSAQLKLCLPLFSLSPLSALPPALPDSAADVLLVGTAGGCIDPEASELEVNRPSGGASDDTICKVESWHVSQSGANGYRAVVGVYV